MVHDVLDERALGCSKAAAGVTEDADELGLPHSRAVINVDRVGNTSAASIPLALADAAAAGRLQTGRRVLLTAFGGGLTWGSATLRWPDLHIT